MEVLSSVAFLRLVHLRSCSKYNSWEHSGFFQSLNAELDRISIFSATALCSFPVEMSPIHKHGITMDHAGLQLPHYTGLALALSSPVPRKLQRSPPRDILTCFLIIIVCHIYMVIIYIYLWLLTHFNTQHEKSVIWYHMMQAYLKGVFSLFSKAFFSIHHPSSPPWPLCRSRRFRRFQRSWRFGL